MSSPHKYQVRPGAASEAERLLQPDALTIVTVLAAVVAPAAVAAGLPQPWQAVAALGGFVVAPCLALTVAVRTPDRILALAVSIGVSLSAVVIFSTGLLYLQVWSAFLLMVCMSLFTVGVVVLPRRRVR